MNTVHQTIFLWCVLATLLSCGISAKLDLSSQEKKRLGDWLQSRLKRDVISAHEVNKADSAPLIGQQESRDTEPLTPLQRIQMALRIRRSAKGAGCSLVTCSYHELVDRIHSQGIPKSKVPLEKLRPTGYGRRRRRSLPRRYALIVEGGHLKLVRH